MTALTNPARMRHLAVGYLTVLALCILAALFMRSAYLAHFKDRENARFWGDHYYARFQVHGASIGPGGLSIVSAKRYTYRFLPVRPGMGLTDARARRVYGGLSRNVYYRALVEKHGGVRVILSLRQDP